MIKEGIEIPEKVIRDVEARHKKVADLAHGRILDIGYAHKPNRHLKGTEVVGIDLDRPDMHIQLFDDCDRNYTFRMQSDFYKVSDYFYPEHFDTILALEFLEHIQNHQDFFRKCNEMLKENGLLIISTPTPFHYKSLISNSLFVHGETNGCPGHIVLHSPRVLNMVARQSGFENVEVTGAAGKHIPFLTYSLLYVYRKVNCVRSN